MVVAKKILFIDDEPFQSKRYRKRLEDEGFEVEFVTTADAAVNVLRSKALEIDFVILDFMMPTPRGVHPSLTSDGQATGRWFLVQCRECLHDHKIPLLIFTNKTVAATLGVLHDGGIYESELTFGVRHKGDTTEVELVEHVQNAIERKDTN
jgi:CheY-like chemotaxis protein